MRFSRHRFQHVEPRPEFAHVFHEEIKKTVTPAQTTLAIQHPRPHAPLPVLFLQCTLEKCLELHVGKLICNWQKE